MTTSTHSPARILAQYLEDQALVTAYNSGTVGFLPDDSNVNDSAVATYDTPGVQDGRMVENGDPVEWPGVQVRIRSLDDDAAWAKAKAIADDLNALTSASVTVGGSGGSVYTLTTVSQQSPVLYLGREQGTRRRSNLTINYLLTYTEA